MFTGENAFSVVPYGHGKCSRSSSCYDVLPLPPQRARGRENTGESKLFLGSLASSPEKSAVSKTGWRRAQGGGRIRRIHQVIRRSLIPQLPQGRIPSISRAREHLVSYSPKNPATRPYTPALGLPQNPGTSPHLDTKGASCGRGRVSRTSGPTPGLPF